MTSLGEISIGCDGFNSRYHPTYVCLGLSVSIINTIKEYGGRGINLCCTSCRLETGSGSNGPQSGNVVDGSRGLDGSVREQAVRDCKEFVCCSGYLDKQY